MALIVSSVVQMLAVLTLTANMQSVSGRSRKPTCTVCKGIADKFDEGVKKTAKSNFGGGNTRWEEKSLGSWQFSETRLIEITESLCYDNDCHNFMEQYEEDIENWWFKRYAKGMDQDFHKYMCVDLVNACCPKNTFGADCTACPGGTDTACKGKGKCNGEGTREGTGKCECDVGYASDLCDQCSKGYYSDSIDTLSCKACHEACDGSCDKEGPVGCAECKKGWRRDLDGACQDVNECEEEEEYSPLCDTQHFCRNAHGSHECEGCDSACEGCTGFGASNCKECKSTYYRDGEECKACDKACESGCSGAGPAACDACINGYTLTEEDICQDVNECKAENQPCGDQESCHNLPGSYNCRACHEACDRCSGESAYNCVQCTSGYEKNRDDQACEDVDECLAEEEVCRGDGERCINMRGSYECNCMKGFLRKAGKCERKPKVAVSYSTPACEICSKIVIAIKKGIKKTDKQNFGGGNTQWEEKKLGVYANSETRFVEVTEDACSDSDKNCNRMLETNEKFLEQWWFNHYTKQKDTDLQEYFCVNRTQACCPNGTYGVSCSECPGGRDQACSGHGDCDGKGTREGTGKCKCDHAYSGDTCGECATNHYLVEPAMSPVVCKACDVSCDDSCTEAGPKGCDSCKDGYSEKEGEGCADIDECAFDPAICGENQFCQNIVGSHSCEPCSAACARCSGVGSNQCVQCSPNYFQKDDQCLECHNSCEGCTGTGTQNCVACRSGWQFQDEACVDINECQVESSPCGPDQYCLNNLGSFRCHECHKVCSGCTAAGPNRCRACSSGFAPDGDTQNPICADVDECMTGDVCTAEGVECENTIGSYRCVCSDKYTRKEGKCIKQKEKKKKQEKTRKNKKKKTEVVKEDADKEDAKMNDMLRHVDPNASPEEAAAQIRAIMHENEEL